MSMHSPAKARPRPRPTPRFSQPLVAFSPTAAASTPGAGPSKPRTSVINNSTAPPIVAREVIDLTTNPIIYISSDDDSDDEDDVVPCPPTVKIEKLAGKARVSDQTRLSPGIAVKAETSSSNSSPEPTSEDEVLANATQAPGSDDPLHGSQASGIVLASVDSQDEEDEDEKGEENEGKEGSRDRSTDDEDPQPDAGKAQHVDPVPSSISPSNKEEDDAGDGDLYVVPANYAAAKQASINATSTEAATPTPMSPPPRSVKSPVAPATPAPSPQKSPVNEGSSDEEEYPPAYTLFSQSRNLAASQSQRELANQALDAFREQDDEDEETKDPLSGVKAQSPDLTMSIPNAFFSAEARKREPSPEDFAMIGSSPEPAPSPLKSTLKRRSGSHDRDRPTKRSRTQSYEGGSCGTEPHRFTPQENSTKRAEIPINEFKRDEDLWLLDGSVIIQIKDIGFRLHETLLSLQFGSFKKLFSSRIRPTRYLHRIPVYKVEGDPEDFKQLYLYILHHRSNNLPFRQLAQIARGAQHFEMERALEDMDRLLSALYPDGAVGTTGHSYAADAVVLAEDCPIFNFILKPAMYDLLCQPTFRFMNGSTDAGEGNGGPPKMSSSFLIPDKRLVQLITARSALLEQWQAICSRESCLLACNSEPSNTCRCAALFPEEALFSPDEELGEAEKDERRDRRQQRMIDAWTRRIYSPPTPPLEPSSDTEAEDTKGTPIKKEHKTNGLSVNKEVEVPTGNKSIMSIGSLDIIWGLKLLARETWEDLECKYCVRVRRRNWKKKETSIWEMLDTLFAY